MVNVPTWVWTEESVVVIPLFVLLRDRILKLSESSQLSTKTQDFTYEWGKDVDIRHVYVYMGQRSTAVEL